MRKFIKFILLAFILTLGVVGICSCERMHFYEDPVDSVIEKKVDDYLPEATRKMYTFSSPTDALLYKSERITQLQIDSVFCNLSDQTIASICAVLKKQQSSFGISDIVYEYKANARIYDALPPDINTEKIISSQLQGLPITKTDTLTINLNDQNKYESSRSTIPKQ